MLCTNKEFMKRFLLHIYRDILFGEKDLLVSRSTLLNPLDRKTKFGLSTMEGYLMDAVGNGGERRS